MSLKRRIACLESCEANRRRADDAFIARIQAAFSSPGFPEERKARLLERFEIAARRRDALPS